MEESLNSQVLIIQLIEIQTIILKISKMTMIILKRKWGQVLEREQTKIWEMILETIWEAQDHKYYKHNNSINYNSWINNSRGQAIICKSTIIQISKNHKRTISLHL